MDVHANVHTLSTQSKLEIKISLCACAWDTSYDSEEERPAEALDLIVLTLFLCSRAKKQQQKKQVQNLYVLQTFEYMKPVASVFAAPAVQLISLMWTFLIRSYLYYRVLSAVLDMFFVCLLLYVGQGDHRADEGTTGVPLPPAVIRKSVVFTEKMPRCRGVKAHLRAKELLASHTHTHKLCLTEDEHLLHNITIVIFLHSNDAANS